MPKWAVPVAFLLGFVPALGFGEVLLGPGGPARGLHGRLGSDDGRDAYGRGVFAKHYDRNGIPGAEFRVNSYTTGHQFMQAAAAAGNGNFIVVWVTHQYGPFTAHLLGKVYDASGAPLTDDFPIGSHTTTQVHPAVAADANGNFLVVWEGSLLGPLSTSFIWGQRFGPLGNALGPQFTVSSYTSETLQVDPAVASDPNGNFLVVWASNHDGSLAGVFGQRLLASGEKQGGEFQVNVYTTGDQRWPTVASDTDGTFVVTWSSPQAAGFDAVFARRIDANGASGDEFRVSSFTTGRKFAPSITSTSSGRFVVAWWSQMQDGSLYGVFGQRFSTDLSMDLIFKDCFSPSCP